MQDDDFWYELNHALWPTRPAKDDGRPAEEDCNEGDYTDGD